MVTHFKNNLIEEIARPLWDNLIQNNPLKFEGNDRNQAVIPHGWEDYTFEDFCKEIELELRSADARN